MKEIMPRSETWFIWFLFVWSAFCACAGGCGNSKNGVDNVVTVWVHDKSGNPLSALVNLKETDTGQFLATRTAPAGCASFDDVPLTFHECTVTSPGYVQSPKIGFVPHEGVEKDNHHFVVMHEDSDSEHSVVVLPPEIEGRIASIEQQLDATQEAGRLASPIALDSEDIRYLEEKHKVKFVELGPTQIDVAEISE